MRLLGYPASKISMLTTYNGQKALLRDVVEQRCAPYACFGRPHRVRRHPRRAALLTHVLHAPTHARCTRRTPLRPCSRLVAPASNA
jgi:hypothetical protein